MAYGNNERGAAVLLYVIMLSLVLAVAGPYLLRMMSSSELSETSYHHQKLADNLAVSATEALFDYLKEFPEDGNQDDYLQAYPGFTSDPVTFQTPEGIPVEYAMQLIGPQETGPKYEVYITVTAGSGPTKRVKAIEYVFNPTPGGLQIVTNDNERITVPTGGNALYVEGNYKDEHVINKTPEHLSDLQTAIATAIDTYKDRVYELYEEYDAWYSEAQVISCYRSSGTCINQTEWDALANQIQNSAWEAIRIPATRGYQAFTVTLGSPSKPVYVFIDGAPDFWSGPAMTVYGAVIFRNGMDTQGMNLTVYGDVLVNGTYSANTKDTVRVYKLNGEGGNFYVLGSYEPNNQIDMITDGHFYADKFKVNGWGSKFDIGGKMIVEQELQFSTSLSQFETGQDMLAGSLRTCCTNHLQSGGDILVEGDIVRDNPMTLTSGGHIAVGGSVTLKSWEHPITVNFGSGSTSLILEGSGGGTGGQETIPDAGGWFPSRKS